MEGVCKLQIFFKERGPFRVAEIKQAMAVDGIVEQYIAQAILVDGQRRITDRQKIYDAQTVRENGQAGGENVVGAGGVVIVKASRTEVAANQLEIVGGEQLRDVVTPVKTGVLNDDVVTIIGVGEQPAPAVVHVDQHFGVGEERVNDGIFGNELEIAGIDFDDFERVYHGIVRQNLAPGAGGQPDHQNSFGRRVKGAERVGANDQILVGERIDIEIAVVDATAKDFIGLSDGDDPIAIFNNAAECG